jgi:hypothetical protein
MKVNRWIIGLTGVCLLLLALGIGMLSSQRVFAQQSAAPQESVGTAFTFQGRLTHDSLPVNDDCQARFELYDAAADGNKIGATLTTPIIVQAGLFTVELDFGNVFDGTALWLDIAVQCSADSTYLSLGRQKLTSVPYAVDSNLLNGNSSAFYQNATNLNAGTLSTDRYSAFTDLGAEGYLGNASGNLAQNNGTLQTNLNADLLDGVHGNLYERSYMEGTVTAGYTQTIEIPHWYPFSLQLASGWPDVGGVAFVTGMENDHFIAITYTAYNGDGTSQTGGAECGEASTAVLLTFGSGNYTYQLKCPGETGEPHNLVLVATNSYVELRYKVIY